MIFDKQYIHCYAPTQRLLAIKIPFPNVKTLSYFKRRMTSTINNHTKKQHKWKKFYSITFYKWQIGIKVIFGSRTIDTIIDDHETH
jgi:hypothetical protein